MADGHHSAFVAESAEVVVGAAIANHRVRVPPFAQDREASWLVDDFYVAAPEWWRTAGGALLDSVAHAARSSRQNRLIVVSAERDDAKNAMLRDRGFRQAAQWWVRPLAPPQSPVPAEGERLPMLVGPAPPVYDPGGPVAMALDTVSPFAIDRFERQAFAAEAVLAIVPVRTADGTLAEVLAIAGYAVASVWYASPAHHAPPPRPAGGPCADSVRVSRRRQHSAERHAPLPPCRLQHPSSFTRRF